MNPLLARQLRRLKVDTENPPDAQTWQKLLSRLDSVFEHNDQTLIRLERSLTISSEEMQSIYATLNKNELQIQQQRDQLDAVLDAVHAGICAISPAGEVLFMNQAGYDLLNIKEGAANNINAASILPHFHTGSQTLDVPRVFDMLSQQQFYHLEHCTLIQDDGDLPVSIHLSSLGSGAEKGFVVMSFQDVSERLRNEEAKQQAQKMAVIGNLVGGIAHELNNMLASITGNLFLAKARLIGQDEVIKRLDIAERLSFDMGDIIAHLMAFSGQSVVTRESIAFKVLVEQVIIDYATTLPGNVIFGYDICDHNLELFGAEEQLQQILSHLLKNAMDAITAASLPTIQVRLQPYTANEKFCAKHQSKQNINYAHLSIQDNGCGIHEQSLPHIFEPFFTGKDFGAGKGLGLSMVQGAVQMHNGIIEVESSLHQGTTFHVYLPLESQHENGESPALETSTTHTNAIENTRAAGNTILLVEDDADVQEIATALLESLDFQVITANDGLEGVEVYQQHQHDIGLVLMDIMMPRMNGTTACKKIRGINPQAKVIFVSGYDQNSAQLSDMGLENELFLSKPYDVMVLNEIISRELGRC